MSPRRSFLFVCWGNICRSPTAEGVMRKVLDEVGLAGDVVVDSAGTSSEHTGDPPDPRAIAEAHRRGIDISDLCARQVQRADFDRFDLLLPVDELVEGRLRRLAPDEHAARKIKPLASFGPDPERHPEVPDPWYGGAADFEHAYELLDAMCRGLADAIRAGAV